MTQDILIALHGTLALVLAWMLLTSPGWITGKIVARRRRSLPVPFPLHSRSLRWVLWLASGAATLVAWYLATFPSTQLGPHVQGFAGIIAALLVGAAMVIAFYIGWTASVRRHGRRSPTVRARAKTPADIFAVSDPRVTELPEPRGYEPATPLQ